MTREEAVEELYRIIENQYRSAEKDKEALGMAIKALEQEPRWIPVSKKLPKLLEWYLTSIKWVDGTERVTISWFDGTSFKAEVVAWMPLPKAYSEVEK